MDIKTIENLIRFHKAGLQDYGEFMDPSSIVLEETTIKALDLLKTKLEAELSTGP